MPVEPHERRLSWRKNLAEEARRLGIVRLREPEHRLLANAEIAVVPGDVDELVECGVVVTSLREHERVMLAQREWSELSVQRDEVGRRRRALANPKQRLLARLNRHVGV